MPDIDVDFDNTKRDEVVQYVKNTYGIDYVGNIISFDTMLPKQVLRDVAKVMNIDSNIVDKLCKTINKEIDFQQLKLIKNL
jgi:DNA polymerase-3 subunit alpha